MNIVKKQIQYNFTNSRGRNIKYIVIHDTGNSSNGANAEAHYRYFNGGNRNASADFFVDDTNILQINDYKNQYSWAVGDGNGRNGITNANSVSIEICINSDGNYDKAVENAIELVKYLMSELNLSVDRVVRHHDASGKICPASMISNNWERWYNFKSKLTSSNSTIAANTNSTEGTGYCTVDTLNVREGASTDYDIQGELNMNEKVALLDKNNGWYKVRYYNAPKEKTMIGWASGTYLRVEKDVEIVKETPIQEKPKKYWVVTDYLPQGEYGLAIKDVMSKYFHDIQGELYIRTNDTKGQWIETCYLPLEKCEELQTRLGKYFWEIKSH